MKLFVACSYWEDNDIAKNRPYRVFIECDCGTKCEREVPRDDEKKVPFRYVVGCSRCKIQQAFLIEYGKYFPGNICQLKPIE